MSPDGNKRKRRNGMRGEARLRWYAYWRSLRFSRRYCLTAN